MATVPKQRRTREVDYPTTDGKPMAETEFHVDELIDAIQMFRDRFAGEPNVYVGGNSSHQECCSWPNQVFAQSSSSLMPGLPSSTSATRRRFEACGGRCRKRWRKPTLRSFSPWQTPW